MATNDDSLENTEATSNASEEQVIRPANTPLADSAEPKNISNTSEDTMSALDLLAKEHEAPELTEGQKEAAEAKAAEDAETKRLADDAKAAEKLAKKKESGTELTESEVKAEAARTEAAAKAAREAAEPQDKLATVKLPPYSKPASTHAFNELKRISREETAALSQKLKDLEAKIPKEGNLPVETAKELEDLRKFRKIHDYRGTREFVDTYVTPISTNENRVFEKLKSAGFTDAHITAIKGVGFANLDWDEALKKVPSTTRRSVEAILLENETLLEKRDKVLKENENNPSTFEAEKKKADEQRTTQELSTIRASVDATLAHTDWVKEKTIPVGATPQQRTEIEGHNAFVKEQRDRLETVMSGRSSPETFADLAASALLAYDFKRQAVGYRTLYTELKAKYDKITKSSSTTRVATGSQPAARGKPPTASVTVDTGDALDALRDQLASQDRE